MAFISADTLLSFNGLPDNLLYSNFKHIVNERIWHMILPTTFFFPLHHFWVYFAGAADYNIVEYHSVVVRRWTHRF